MFRARDSLPFLLTVMLLAAGITLTASGTEQTTSESLYVSPSGSTYTSIQAAVDASTDGDTVIVANGTYIESVTVDKEITLRGNSSADCKIEHHYIGSGTSSDFASAFNITADNVNVSGFYIDVTGAYTHGFDARNVGNVSISGNDIYTTGDYGKCIYLYHTDNATVENNYMNTTGYGGIGVNLTGCQETVVDDNYINTTGNYAHGVSLHFSSKNNNVTDNTIYTEGSRAEALYYYVSSPNGDITGNYLNTTGHEGTGIRLQGSSGMNIIDNEIHNFYSGTYGIWLHGGTDRTSVFGCSITTRKIFGHGIYLIGGHATVEETYFRTVQGPDLYCAGNSIVWALNTTIFDLETTGLGGGTVYIQNYLDIKAFYQGGTTPLDSADVVVKDNTDVIYASSGFSGSDPRTSAQGYIPPNVVTDRTYDHSNTAVENTTTVNITKTVHAAWFELRDVDMSTSHTEVFTAADIHRPQTPAAPDIERVLGTNDLKISWEKNTDDTVLYSVQYQNTTGWEYFDNVTHPTNFTYHYDLKDNTWYTYRLIAWDAAGNPSLMSAQTAYQLADTTPPATPTGFDAEVFGNQDAINVTWNKNTEDTISYELWWNNGTTGTDVLLKNITHPQNWYYLGPHTLKNGSTYSFKLRARDPVGLLSDFTDPVEVTHKDQVAPAAPAGLKAQTLSTSSIGLSWSSTDLDIVKYQIFVNRSSAGSGGPYMLMGLSTEKSYEAKGLADNTTYYFVVLSTDEANNTSPMSNQAHNTTIDIPDRPRVVATVPLEGTLNISLDFRVEIQFDLPMNKLTFEDHFDIEPAIPNSLEWALGGTVLLVHFPSNLTENTTYTITIGEAEAVTGGILQANPFTLTFTTVPPPPPPPPEDIIVEIRAKLEMTEPIDIDTPIVIKFTHALDKTKAEGAVSVDPSIGYETFEWSEDGLSLTIFHDNLTYSTEYDVTVAKLDAVFTEPGFVYFLNCSIHNFTVMDEPLGPTINLGPFKDVLGAVISGAFITAAAGDDEFTATTGENGIAVFEDMPFDAFPAGTTFTGTKTGFENISWTQGETLPPFIPVVEKQDDDDDDTGVSGALIAGVIGGILLLLVVIGIILFILMKKKKAEEEEAPAPEAESGFECPDCGGQVAANATVCSTCGATFGDDYFECSNCGYQISADATVCPSCGELLSEDDIEDDEEVEIEGFVCPNCEYPVDESATACPNCGEDFTEEGYECTSCGATVPEDAMACPACGEVFADEEEGEFDYSSQSYQPYNAPGADQWYASTEPEQLYECPTCGATIAEDAKRCPECDEVFEDDGELAYDNVEEDEIYGMEVDEEEAESIYDIEEEVMESHVESVVVEEKDARSAEEIYDDSHPHPYRPKEQFSAVQSMLQKVRSQREKLEEIDKRSMGGEDAIYEESEDTHEPVHVMAPVEEKKQEEQKDEPASQLKEIAEADEKSVEVNVGEEDDLDLDALDDILSDIGEELEDIE